MDGAPSKSLEDEQSENSVENEERVKEAHDDRAPSPSEVVIVQEEEEYAQHGTTALDEEREAKEKESNSARRGIKPDSEKETIITSKIKSKKKKKPNKQRRDKADTQTIRLRTKPPRSVGEEQKSQRDEKRNREGAKSELDSKMELGELSLQGGADTSDIGSEPQVRSCVQCLSNHR
jgi:hypothetical protein